MDKKGIHFSWLDKVKGIFDKKKTKCLQEDTNQSSLPKENPYLPQIRMILEQILLQKGSSYREFFPILIAGEDNWPTLKAAKALAPELNRLVILTKVPAYFEEFTETMYEERGLLVEVLEKNQKTLAGILKQTGGCKVLLDFEQPNESNASYAYENTVTIPVFKKEWENRANLDIAVPIGYNIAIVSIAKTEKESPYLDRFERAFYENE